MNVNYNYEDERTQQRVKIAMNKLLLKEFKQNSEMIVYLEDGNEFQIQIFNDQTTEIGAMIYINGEVIGSSILVIRPGERVWLERYLDKNNKFKFSTYEVNGNNEAVKKAIANNGVIEVKLYKKAQSCFSWPRYNDLLKATPSTSPYHYDPYICPSPYEPEILYCQSECTPINGIINFSSNLGSCDTNISTTSASLGSASTFTCTKDYSLGLNTFASGTVERKSNKTETGRVVEGGKSDQEFNYVDMNFESFPFSTEKIHILPKSMKPVHSNDLQKIYCHNCGRKLKTKFNYCPFCGAKQ